MENLAIAKKTLVNVISNIKTVTEIETIIFSDIDDKGVETKTLIREITTIYGDYETTQNIKESSYTGDEYDLVLKETTKATVTYDVTGIEMENLWYVETVEHSSLQASTMVKDRVMKSYYNMDANVIKEEIITYNKSTGAVSSTITTEYKYDDNANCIEERSYDGGTLQGVYTYEYIVA